MVAVLVSVIAAFFYVRVIVTMFFSDPAEGDAEVAQAGWGTQAVLVVSCVLTVVLAVVPGWLLTLSAQAGQFLR